MIKYRRDIDGLRSLAVLPVIFYHFAIAPFSGGFVGVDIFFVISGFLITGTLKTEIENGSFSIIAFYERRARRILPALFAMIAVSAVIGGIIFLPDDFSDLGANIVAVVLFVSNILLWHQIDYFAPGIDLKPMAHTWSLAVEEQYYLIFPLFLVAIWKWFGRRFILFTLLLAALSFLLSVVGVARMWPGTYYLLPMRAWELLVGSLLALGVAPRLNNALLREGVAMAGLVGVLAPTFILTDLSPFPGVNALWPVLGAAALIHAGSSGQTMVSRLLSLPPFVGVGLISYSLYLWHWPLIVFARYQYFGVLAAHQVFALLVATFLLAWASWRYIERPFRNRTLIARPLLFQSSGVAMLALIVVGGTFYVGDGFPGRFPQAKPILAKINAETHADNSDMSCIIDRAEDVWGGPQHCTLNKGSGGTRILMWGDSHAHHFAYALRHLARKPEGSIMLYGMTGCPPIFDVAAKTKPGCETVSARVPELIRQNHIQRVLISGFWNNKAQVFSTGKGSLVQTIERLRAMGVEVVVIADNPVFYLSDPAFLAARMAGKSTTDSDVYLSTNNDPKVAARIRAIAHGKIFDPMPLLCKSGRCLAYTKGNIINLDNTHLSRFGANIVLVGMGSLLD